MAWVKLDDGFFRNPKVVIVGPEAKLLYLAGLCYAGSSLTDGFIPANAARILGADAEISTISNATQELVDAGLWAPVERGYMIHDYLQYNKSAEEVRANKEAARERMQRRRSPDVRANNERTSGEVRSPDTDTDTDSDSDESPSPLPPSGEEDTGDVEEEGQPKRKPSAADLRFQRFWSAYPSKVGKGAARKAWDKLKPDDALTDRMLAAIATQQLSDQWTRDGGRYIPHPATWLNQERWEDEIKPTAINLAAIAPPGVELLPGETATQVGPGAWDLVDHRGIKRTIKPEYHGVIYDQRRHMGSDGLKAFWAEVNAAKATHDERSIA